MQNPSPVVPASLSYPIADDVHVYEGGIVALDASGNVLPMPKATSGYTPVGFALAEADNTVVGHAAGALNVQIMQGVGWLVNGGDIDATMIGTVCYAENDQTVYHSATGRTAVGVIYGVDSVKGVAVHIQLPTNSLPQDLTTFEANLASTSVNEGASLIGIQDAAGYYGAGTVEAALVEVTEEPIFCYSSQVTLSTIANSDVVAAIKPNFKCKIIAVQFTPTIAVSTSAKAATLTTKINTTAVTGGVLALTSSNCNTKGTQVAGTTVTGAQSVGATDTVNVVASSVTTFVEGEGMINILFGRA